MQDFRRIIVRWEYKLSDYIAFVLLGCVRILLRQLAVVRAVGGALRVRVRA